MNRPYIQMNQDRWDITDRFPSRGDDQPCYICGRPVKPGKGYEIHVIDGGFRACHPDDNDPYDGAGELGWQPVDTGCVKKHPELKGYFAKEKVHA